MRFPVTGQQGHGHRIIQTEHLNQIDQEARKQVEILMEQMVKKQGATEELKAQDQMKWVRLMINIKSSAEEIVVKNTIYM